MKELPPTIPSELPGIHVAFGLKQCLGKQDLFHRLLHRFWEDYRDSWKILHDPEVSVEDRIQLLHNLKGVTSNLGMSDLSRLCHQLREHLRTQHHLGLEAMGAFHTELEKVGGSVKTLDSFIEN